MTDYGLVSIITPSYNSAEFVEETINSILVQTYTNWELLITDDCSSDNTCEIVERYAGRDSRIKLFRLSRNSGAGVARNKSIEEAKGRFIAFCDSDDCWLPEKLEKQLAFMEEKGSDFSFTSYYVCQEQGSIYGRMIAPEKASFFDLVCDDCIGCLTAMYNVEALGKFYMPTIRRRQDWGLWLTIIQKSKYAYGLKECLALYRLRSNSLSSNKLALVSYNINVYRKVLQYSLLKSYLVFIFLFMPAYTWKKLKYHWDRNMRKSV